MSSVNKLIIKDNKYCQFVTSDLDLFREVSDFLSYKIEGAMHIPSVQRGFWDGITRLLNKKGYFLLGLLPKVKKYFKQQGIPFVEEDQRHPLLNNEPLDLTDKLKELGITPRDYQEQIIKVACSNQRGIVRSCTASGKTLCTALITARLNKPTIIYVVGLDLLKQFHELFSQLFSEPIGYIGGGVCQIARINIATIWTVSRALKVDKKNILVDDEGSEEEQDPDASSSEKIVKMLGSTKVHIFDESHIATEGTVKSIFEKIDPEHIYGFSGTPFKQQGVDLLINGIMGEQLINISASMLIERGILPQPLIKFVPVPHIVLSEATYPSAYKQYIVENEPRNKLIIKETQSLLDKKYVPLVLFRQINHGKILLELMEEAGIKVEMLYGNDSLAKRTEVKQLLNEKKIDVILASTVFDIGIDLPILSSLVLASGGKATGRALQRIGRILRPLPGKKQVAVVDFFDQCKYLKKHSNIRAETYLSEKGFKVFKCREMK